MPERIVKRARNFTPNLYFTIPFKTKKKYNIRRGCKVKCILKRIADSDGNVIVNTDREITCEVAKRDGRIYPPPSLFTELNMIGTEYYEIILTKLITPDSEEIEPYPNENVENEIALQLK